METGVLGISDGSFPGGYFKIHRLVSGPAGENAGRTLWKAVQSGTLQDHSITVEESERKLGAAQFVGKHLAVSALWLFAFYEQSEEMFVLLAEVVQFHTGLGTFDVDDIILNMSAIFVGYIPVGIAGIARKTKRKKKK